MDESDEYTVTTYWREWHLTPTGWVKGRFNSADGTINEIELPPGRVLTAKYEETGSPRLGFIAKEPPKIISEGYDKRAVKRLIKKFGKMPRKT